MNCFKKILIRCLTLLITFLLACSAEPKMKSVYAVEESEITFANGIWMHLKKGTRFFHPKEFNGKDISIILEGDARFKVPGGYRLTVEYKGILINASDADFSVGQNHHEVEITVLHNEVSIVSDKEQLIIPEFHRATYSLSTKRLAISDTRYKNI